MLLSQSLAQEDGNIMIWLMVLNEYRIVSLDQDWRKTSLNYFCQRNNKYQNLLLLLSLLLPKECSGSDRSWETRRIIILSKEGLSLLLTCLDTVRLTTNYIFIHASGTSLSWSESWWRWSFIPGMGWEYNTTYDGTPVHHRVSHTYTLSYRLAF